MSDPELAESTDVLKHFDDDKTSDDLIITSEESEVATVDKSRDGPWILTPRVLLAIALGQVCFPYDGHGGADVYEGQCRLGETDPILRAQFLALMITASGITSSYIAEKGINLPQLQGLINYVCLAAIYTPVLVCRHQCLHL
jgi:hypothetical protein